MLEEEEEEDAGLDAFVAPVRVVLGIEEKGEAAGPWGGRGHPDHYKTRMCN